MLVKMPVSVKIVFIIILITVCLKTYSQKVQPAFPNLSHKTHVAPEYFGPNALPVPDMLDGRIENKLTFELAGDWYMGNYGDNTQDLFAAIHIPLFTQRANLSVWMPVVEFYRNTAESLEHREVKNTDAIRGHEFGDVYISTDIQLFYERKFIPDVAMRVTMKTASGGGYQKARYFDDPGYFFDLAVGKSWKFENSYMESIRVAGSAGFLCWQTDNGRQNDAVMYGVQLKIAARHFIITETWGGYLGWERDGDQPMTIKSRISFPAGAFEPYLHHQYGIEDYPFHQFRVGLIYRIPLFGKETHLLPK